MSDRLIRALAVNERVRIFICDTTDLVDEARKRHDLWPTASAALGRVLSVTSMLGANLKSEQEKITVTINGGGPIGTIMADGDHLGNVRGFVGDPHVHYEYNDTKKLAVGIAVGKDGYLEVKKGMGMKEDFSGKVALQTGEIGDDFAYYFALSEQTPSVVSVGVLVDTDNSIISSGGIIIQMMPDAQEEDIEVVENAVKTLKPMSELIASGMSLEVILDSLFDDVRILGENEISFKCKCSRDKMEAALSTIDNNELADMIEKDNGCEITCQFCETHYRFSADELQAIIDKKQRKN